jgi:hypothetical protein
MLRESLYPSIWNIRRTALGENTLVVLQSGTATEENVQTSEAVQVHY